MTTQHIRPGVFFSPSTTLPRGRHALDRDAVQNAQRERLMVAFTELVADNGLAATTVTDIVARAAVSRSAFYSSFADLAECADAAYERFISVLLRRLIAVIDPIDRWQDLVESAVFGYLGALQDDPVVARAMQIEMDAAGRSARTRRRGALTQIARVIAARHADLCREDPTIGPLPEEAFLGTVYAVRQLACDALDSQPHPNLLALAQPIITWVAAGVAGASTTLRSENSRF